MKNPKGLAAVGSHPFGSAQGRLLGTKRPRMGHPPLDDADENQELLKGGPPPGAYDFNVWTSRKRVEKLRYMHRNPVKRGLVGSPELWR